MACGCKNSNAPKAEGTDAANATEATLKTINADNWTVVVKKTFNLDATMPAGWTVKSVISQNKVNNIDMFLVRNANDKSFEEYAKELWAATLALDPRNNLKLSLTSTVGGEQVTDFAVGNTSSDMWGWFYYPSPDAEKQCRLDFWINDENTVEIKLLNMNL